VSGLRRLVVIPVAALAFAAPAHAATLTVVPSVFSPHRTHVVVSAHLTVPRQAGLRLTTLAGRPVGWIARPTRRAAFATGWDGRIDGRQVHDGSYLVQLVYRSSVLATSVVRIVSQPPKLLGLAVNDGTKGFAGDNRLLTTISPNGDGFRDVANVVFRLHEPATVQMQVTRTVKAPVVIWQTTYHLGRGPHVLTWAPAKPLNPRTYMIRLRATDAAGNTIVYGAPNAHVGRYPKGPVVRVQGIDAGFTKPSYAPGETGYIQIATDAPSFTMATFQSGPEKVVTYADNQFAGVPAGDPPVTVDWTAYRDKPHVYGFRIPDVPSGLYYVALNAPDGRVGYAPFVVHPTTLGATGRILVILPTNTWQAYNFQDVDGNGYGDTWYAGPPNRFVDLSKGYIARGVPPRFYRYDLPFLHWLYWSGKSAEFISDSDFDWIRTGDDLARAYDLVVFEGHEEYVTGHEYDVVQRFRDLGGNLMFLSANNFFWQVRKQGQVLQKIGEWRQDGRPEARLIGVQYRANDNGQRQGQFVVQNAALEPWLWDGTGLADGSMFGAMVGGYGIEIDATSPLSPPGTTVVAQIPDLYGPGITAQMAYYELANGAKVFAAGALDFGGSATFWPVKKMLDNLWARLSAP
jgi:hypothetical protein